MPGAAIVMKTLKTVPVETLVKAFSHVKSLTALDADTMARDANGIIAAHVSFDDARIIVRELDALGVPCQVLSQEDIPDLPNRILSRQARLHNGCLELQDALGRPLRHAAENLFMLCAGAVMLEEQVREKVEEIRGVLSQHRSGRYGQHRAPPKTYTRTRYETRRCRVCDVFLNREPWRVRLLDGACPGVVMGLAMNDTQRDAAFAEWIRQLVAVAPQAIRNRGVSSCLKDGAALYSYSSRHSFEEECRWWCWHSRQTA